jgi:ferredoxin-NADP reductase/Na+-translocating ferredoxin:NAD+ oxidoreductase RnfD subunit
MKLIDNFLDKITMYRLVVYFLLLLLIVALIYSFFGILRFNPFLLLFSTVFLTAVCWVSNKVFAKTFSAPANVESVYITALILALIITPAQSLNDVFFLFWAGVLAMASKYIVAIHKKHIFNPAAIALVITAFAGVGTASWWVGTLPMFPFELLGLLVVRKIRRFDLVFYFFIVTFATIGIFTMLKGGDLLNGLRESLIASSLFFFSFVMLTEPLTTPPTKKLQSLYGAFVGLLFAPQFHIGTFYTTPEIALVIGNVFSYCISPKTKIVARLVEKNQISSDIYDFGFVDGKPFAFSPGQYMEWTLPHPKTDSRGNRRYFTIASSPTEKTIRLGIRFYQKSSSFKNAMLAMEPDNKIGGSQISGDFILPNDKMQKLVFIAGGIGITPFRSMIKYLIDKNEARSIVMFYVNKKADEIAYSDIFDQAQQLGIKTVYTLTDKDAVPSDWQGQIGRIDSAMIQGAVPDFKERIYYLSGPHAMVVAYEEVLRGLGVSRNHIKKDFFPGLI